LSIRGVARLRRGVSDRDGALLLAAADAYREAGHPLYEAYAYENAAAVFAAEGHVTDARAGLETALDRYDHLDAGWDASRAESRLRQAGVRRRGTRRRPRTGRAAL